MSSNSKPSEYFEAMTAAVFQSGLSARVVENKWDGFERAFAGFDPNVVARFSPDDIDRLVTDEFIIRNRRKIEATVHNASRIVDIDEELGFEEWLESHGSTEKARAAISKEFRFMGPTTTNTFLHMVSSEGDMEAC